MGPTYGGCKRSRGSIDSLPAWRAANTKLGT
jgi:hypothetical protein